VVHILVVVVVHMLVEELLMDKQVDMLVEVDTCQC